MTEGAVRVAVHRLRRRYRELLREEIAQTLSDPAQVDEEMQALVQRAGGRLSDCALPPDITYSPLASRNLRAASVRERTCNL